MSGTKVCPKCRTEIDTKATICPQCRSNLEPSGCAKVFQFTFIVISGVTLLLFISASCERRRAEALKQRLATLNIETTTTTSTPTTTIPIGAQWNYSTSKDEMDGTETKYASIESINTLSFDFPYQGEQRMRLTFRSNKKTGKEALLLIEKGQFNCSAGRCSVLIKFDDGQPVLYSAGAAASGRSDALFVLNASSLISAMKKKKQMMLQVDFYQYPNKVLRFNVEGFDFARLH